MNRLVKLLDKIRMLDWIDMMAIESENDFDYQCIKDLESILKEFYTCGYENGQGSDIDPEIDFENRLSNFYSEYDRP